MAEVCNVLQLEDLEVINTGGFNDFSNVGGLRVLPNAQLQGNDFKLLNQNLGAVATGVWINEAQRLSEGFILELEYTAAGGESDGFAVVMQNEGLENTVAGSGQNLGFSLNFESYFAVALDFCTDREAFSCDEDKVRIERRTNGGAPVVNEVDVPGGLKGTNRLVISFVELPDEEVTVEVGGVTLGPISLPPFSDFLGGSKFGFVGLTGSSLNVPNTVLTPLDVTLTLFNFQLMNSNVRLQADQVGVRQTDAVNGDLVTFRVEFVDSCGNKLEAAPEGVSLDNVVAQLIPNNLEANDILVPLEDGVAFDENDGAVIVVSFATPANVVETWALELSVEGIDVQRTPFEGIVTSEVEGEGGLGALGISLISALMVVLFIIVVVIAVQAKKNRDNLKKNKENIEWGLAKEETKRIEKEVTYEVSPLMLPLEEIKERLARNEELLKDLRAKGGDVVDSDRKVADLKAKNDQLRQQIAELKKKNEYAEAAGDGKTSYGRSFKNKKLNTFDEEEEI